MRPPSLSHLLWLVSIVAAINPSLRHLCLSPLVDSPISEEDFENRIQGDACVQKFPYPGTAEQHETFCRSTLPFDFMVLSRSDGEVTCKWTVASSCKDIQYQQIYDKCYHVGVCGKHDMKKAKPISPDEVRWISILYGDHYQVLHMEKSRSFNDKQKSGFFEGGVMWKDNNGEAATDAMVLTRMAAFGLYPGDFVKTSDPMVNALCSARADAIGSVSSIVTEAAVATNTQLPSIGTVNTQMNTYGTGYAHTTVIIPSGYAFPTRNVYRARLMKDGAAVNVKYFHEVCGTICHGCYAATYESFETYKDKMPDGRYWVPVSRASEEKAHKKDDSCNQFEKSKFKKFEAQINAFNTKKHIPQNSQWSNAKVPFWGCSDGDRLAVQIVKNGNSLTYVDVPEPPVPVSKETGKCFPYSHFVNGKCKCLPGGYEDALKIRNLANKLRQMGYNEWGTICVKKVECTTMTSQNLPKAIIFMLDGSTTVNRAGFDHLKRFVRKMGEHLPKSVPVTLYTYATNKHDGLPPSNIREIPSNWNLNVWQQTADKLDYMSVGSSAHTFFHMNDMINMKKQIKGRKLVIWISNNAQDTDQWNVASRLGQENFHLVGIAVAYYGWDFAVLIKDSKDKMMIDNYAGLTDRVMQTIVNTMCPAYPDSLIGPAIGQ